MTDAPVDSYSLVFGERLGYTPESLAVAAMLLTAVTGEPEVPELADLLDHLRSVRDGCDDDMFGTLAGTTLWDPSGDAVVEVSPDGTAWRMKCGWSDWEWVDVRPPTAEEVDDILASGDIRIMLPVDHRWFDIVFVAEGEAC